MVWSRARLPALRLPAPRLPALSVLSAAALIGLLGLVALSSKVRAAELLMYEEQGCPWCRRWHAEIGPAYPNTVEGQRAPLRKVDIHGSKPDGILLALPVRASPTFVLVESGREIGRITGYPGAEFFWGLLNGLLVKLEQDAPAKTTKEGSAAAASLPIRP